MKSQEPEIEQQKDNLTIQIATGKNQLYALQSQILQELADANPDTILDNITLIGNLEVSKDRSRTIAENLAEAEQVEVVINKTRNFYRPVAERGAILYFAITDLSGINEMYQNSLQYVKKLFNEAITSARKVKSAEGEEAHLRLLRGLVDAITRQLYEKICIGLFGQHKLVYAFNIATSIQRKLGVIVPALWNYLLRGAGVFDKAEMPEKPESLSTIAQSAWELIYRLSTFKFAPANESQEESKEPTQERGNPFAGLVKLMFENEAAFARYVADETEHGFFDRMPCSLSANLTPFEKILLVRCLKPEKVLFAVQKYLELDLGPEYAVSPISSMETLF